MDFWIWSINMSSDVWSYFLRYISLIILMIPFTNKLCNGFLIWLSTLNGIKNIDNGKKGPYVSWYYA